MGKRIFAALLSGIVAFSSYGSLPINAVTTTTVATASTDAPASVTGLKYKSKTNSITLSWTASADASGYYIYVKSTKEPYNFYKLDTITDGKTASWTTEISSSGKIFEFRVYAYKTVNSKNIMSNYAEIITSTVPGSVRTIVISNIAETSATIKWGAVSGADGYCIYRKLSSDSSSNYKRVKLIQKQEIVEWNDTKLSAGKEYDYLIKPYKKVGENTLYGEKVIKSMTTLPKSLTGLALKARSTDTIKLTWNASTGASGYYIDVKSTKEPYNYYRFDTVEDGTATSWTKTGLSSGKTFEFRVQPYKIYGEKTYKGGSQEIVTGTLPGTVRTIVLSDITSNSMLVKWGTVSGADGYVIKRKLDGESDYKTVKTITEQSINQWKDTGLPAGTNCTYAIRAYKIIEKKYVFSSYVRKEGYTLPEAIENLTVKKSNANSITLSWDKTEGADGYDIYKMSTKEYGKYYLDGSVDSADITEYTDDSLSSGTEYSYKVSAYKNFNDSKKHGKEAYAVGETLTAAVKSLKVSERTTSEIKLSWLPAKGADGYIVYKKDEGESGFSEYTRVPNDNDKTIYFTDSKLNFAYARSYRIVAYSYINNKLSKSDFAEVNACTLPKTVENLKVATVSTSSVKLTWNKVDGATGYIIYRQGSSDTTKYYTIATIESNTEVSYLDKDLSSAVPHEYRVLAYKTVDDKKYVGEYASETGCTYPAKSSGIKAVSQTTNAIKINWNEIKRVDGYRIYKVVDGSYKLIKTVSSDVRDYVIRDLEAGSLYKFAVAGYKNYNTNDKACTTIGSKIILEAVTAPDVTTSFTSSNRSTDSLTLNWKPVSGATGYYIYKESYTTGEIYMRKEIEDGTTVSYRDSELLSGESQYYRIAAYKEINGKKVVGGYKELTTYTIPMPANNLKVMNKTDKGVRLVWDEVSGAAGYKIERKLSSSSSYSVVATIKGSSNNIYVDRNLTSGAGYTYRIRAYKSINGATVYSQYKSVNVTTFSQTDLNNMKNEIIRLVNVERNKVGLKSLSVNTKNSSGSTVRAKEIATKFDHVRPNGTKYYTAFSGSYKYTGENIGHHANMTAQNIVQLWMNSDGHRANILNPNYTSTSVGLYLDIDSTDVIYVAQNFFG